MTRFWGGASGAKKLCALGAMGWRFWAALNFTVRGRGRHSVLIYETQDSAFAASVIDALERAGIDCYRTGGLLAEVPYSDPTICIHIRDPADRLNANEILIKVGAAIDDPERFPPKWVFAVLAVVAVIVAFWITSEWK